METTRDPRRGGRVGGRDRDARGARRDALRPGVREQGRHDGLQQPPSPRPGLGHELRAAHARAQARDAERLARAPRQRSRRRLPRGGAAPRRARRVPQRELGRARAVLGGVAVRADAGARAARPRPALARERRARRPGGPAAPRGRPLRQPVPHLVSLLARLPRPPDRRRGAPRVAPARRLLPSAAALGHGAQVPGRLRAHGRAAARPHRRGRRGTAARAGRDPLQDAHERHRPRARAHA